MSVFLLNSKEHLRDQTGNLSYFWQYQRCNLLAPDTSVWIICRLQRSAKQLLDGQPDLPNNIQERGSKFYRDEVLLFFEHWDKMKRKRQLLRAKLSNMLLSLDTTIGFHLYFKAAKFEKMVWDMVETGNKGREIRQGKAESIHGPGLAVGTSAGMRGGIAWAGAAGAGAGARWWWETRDLHDMINTRTFTPQIHHFEAQWDHSTHRYFSSRNLP